MSFLWRRKLLLNDSRILIFKVRLMLTVWKLPLLPNLTSIRVLHLRTKFIPKWNAHNKNSSFVEFNKIRHRLNTKACSFKRNLDFLCYARNSEFFNYFFPPVEDNHTNSICRKSWEEMFFIHDGFQSLNTLFRWRMLYNIMI